MISLETANAMPRLFLAFISHLVQVQTLINANFAVREGWIGKKDGLLGRIFDYGGSSVNDLLFCPIAMQDAGPRDDGGIHFDEGVQEVCASPVRDDYGMGYCLQNPCVR